MLDIFAHLIESMKKYNFSAGPAILPQSVFEEASQAVVDFNGKGLSILEISHRSPDFQAVMDEAYVLASELLRLPDNYDLMFLQGGASTQFALVPMNILGGSETAGYIETGRWAEKAIEDARLYGNVEILASSSDENYSYIPKEFDVPAHLKYLHITSNNTVCGTQYHRFPETDVKLVADMSSDIFSRPVDINKFGLIYAGAQKNMGPAGTVLVVVDKDFVGTNVRQMPNMFSYANHMAKKSMYNTPPVFAVYVSMLTMRWIKSLGGLEGIQQRNEEKARLIYDEIDKNSLFYGTNATEDRSLMSVTFKLHDENLTNSFLNECKEAGCIGIKGHRSVGGFRASIYNAMEINGVKALVDLMQTFEKAKG